MALERTSSRAVGLWCGEDSGALGRTSSPGSPCASPERDTRSMVDEDVLAMTSSRASTDSLDRMLNIDYSEWMLEPENHCASFEPGLDTAGGGSNLSGSGAQNDLQPTTALWDSDHSQAADQAAMDAIPAGLPAGLAPDNSDGFDLGPGELAMGMRNLSVSNEPALPSDLSADLLPTSSFSPLLTPSPPSAFPLQQTLLAADQAQAAVQPAMDEGFPALELDEAVAAAELPCKPSPKPSHKSGRRTPSERSAKYVPAAGPEINPEIRTRLANATTPSSPSYDRGSLSWYGARNTQQCYSYSGSCRPAGEGPAVRCNNCNQFYFIDELGADTLTPGFLPHQQNYEFKCAWCNRESSGKLEETFQLKKPKLFEAMTDAVLNMMYEHKRLHFKEDEIRTYLFYHWNTLMFGWPPLVAERSPTGEGTKFRKGGSLAPELHKKSNKHSKCKVPIFAYPREKYYQLCNLAPRQPMEMLRPGEQWDTTSTAALQVVRSVEQTEERRTGAKEKSMGRLLSRSAIEPGAKGAKKHSRTPRPSAEAAASLGAHLALPDDDPAVAILAELQEQLQNRMEWGTLLEQQAAEIERNAGTPRRVCNLLDHLFELRNLVSATDILCAVAVALRKGNLLGQAVALSRESWPDEAFSKLEEAWDGLVQSLEGQRSIVEQFVGALGQDGAMKAFRQAVENHCQNMLFGVWPTNVAQQDRSCVNQM